MPFVAVSSAGWTFSAVWRGVPIWGLPWGGLRVSWRPPWLGLVCGCGLRVPWGVGAGGLFSWWCWVVLWGLLVRGSLLVEVCGVIALVWGFSSFVWLGFGCGALLLFSSSMEHGEPSGFGAKLNFRNAFGSKPLPHGS